MNYYPYMLRVLKSYNFPTRNPNVGSETVTFSSRPGDFNSKDDFYILSSGLKIMETSLLNYVKSNFK
jgi:Phospholipase B